MWHGDEQNLYAHPHSDDCAADGQPKKITMKVQGCRESEALSEGQSKLMSPLNEAFRATKSPIKA